MTGFGRGFAMVRGGFISPGGECMPGKRCLAQVECQLVASVLERMKQLVDRLLTSLARFGQHVIQVVAHLLERLLVLVSEIVGLLAALLAVCGQRLAQLFGSGSILVRNVCHERLIAFRYLDGRVMNLFPSLIPHLDRSAEMSGQRRHSVGEFRHGVLSPVNVNPPPATGGRTSTTGEHRSGRRIECCKKAWDPADRRAQALRGRHPESPGWTAQREGLGVRLSFRQEQPRTRSGRSPRRT